MKTVVVTGASHGIGRATALQLLDEGYTVIGTYNTGKAEAESLVKAHPQLTMLQADFSQRESTQALIDQLTHRRLDGLVNNAGVFEEMSTANLDIKVWDQSFEVNVTAPLLLSTGLKFADHAAIVNVASVDAYFAGFLGIGYAASKAALINLTKSLAVNLAPRVRVNAVAPGWINTAMGADATGVEAEAIAKAPLKRNGTPEEVAALICFLLSDKASFVNAEIINVDGGYRVVDEVLQREAAVTKKG
jgi:NAD(P)-dependent dehydrogenase (short-subunit alcohol dehydrogenase family)